MREVTAVMPVLVVVSLLLCAPVRAQGAGLVPAADPVENAGLRLGGQPRAAVPTSTTARAGPVRLAAVDAVIQQAIADGNIPGAVLVVGHDGKVIYRRAY